MKENTKWHGLTQEEAGRGYQKTQVVDRNSTDEPMENFLAEITEEPEGFLERQNVFDRI